MGQAQADASVRLLRDLSIQYMVASPLDRTRQTATLIDQHLGISINTDDRLKEWDCGDWSGEMWDDLSEK